MPPGEKLIALSRGKLDDLPLVEILGHAYANRLTGKLRLVRENSEKSVYFLRGLPAFAASDPPEAGLLQILSEVNRLSRDDLLQLQALQREKGTSDEELIRLLGLASDAVVYELRTEACVRAILEGCGWKEGRYSFRPGDEQLEGLPLFDLNPLELIYHGIRSHHLLDLPQLIQALQGKYAVLNHGWEETLALPGDYFRHSDLLDLFEQGANIGEAIPGLYAALGDLNEALLLIYLLLVTGILEITADGTRPARKAGKTGRPAAAAEARATVSAPVVQTGETSYIITSDRASRKAAKKARAPRTPEPVEAPAPAPTPPAVAATTVEPLPLGAAPAAAPPAAPPAAAVTAATISETGVEVFPVGFDTEGIAILSGADLTEVRHDEIQPPPIASAPAEPDQPGDGEDEEGVEPESMLMVLPDAEYPYFDEEQEPARSLPEQSPAPDLAKTRAAFADLEARVLGAQDPYDRLGVEMDATLDEIEKAYDGLTAQASVDHLPEELREIFFDRQRTLLGTVDEAFHILTDPAERIAVEQAIFNKRKERARTHDQKEKLAEQQWRRGKWYLENSSRADLARRCFQEALELDDRKPQYFAWVGWALYRNNRSPEELIEARAYLKQALGLNPRYGEAHYFLGLIDKREGEMDAARRHFQEAVRLNPDDRQAHRELNLMQGRKKQEGIIGRMFRWR